MPEIGSEGGKVSDAYAELRALSLVDVLSALGFPAEGWKPRKAGTEFSGKCPVHGGQKNGTAFSFNVDGRFQCFSCHAKGKGSIDLLMAVRKIGFQEAVNELQAVGRRTPAPSTPHPAAAREDPPATENPVFRGSYEKYYIPSDWLAKREFLKSTLEEYGVGQYDNPKRQSAYKGSVLLKISRYCDGECVGYLSRNVGEITPEKPKYVFPKGLQKSLELFGAWQIKNSETIPLRICYLVESPFAVMAFHQKGFHAVSPFGWSLSDEQISIIAQLAKGVIYIPDRNKFPDIGESVRRLAQHCWVKTPNLPEGIEDPESLSLEQIKALA